MLKDLSLPLVRVPILPLVRQVTHSLTHSATGKSPTGRSTKDRLSVQFCHTTRPLPKKICDMSIEGKTGFGSSHSNWKGSTQKTSSTGGPSFSFLFAAFSVAFPCHIFRKEAAAPKAM